MVEYTTSIVTFIDILGFREFVEENISNPTKVKKVLEIFYRVNKPVSALPIKPKVIVFSDSVVRIINIYRESNKKIQTDTLYQEILNLAWIQGHLFLELEGTLVERGILIRGAVTLGKIVADEYKYNGEKGNMLFGPAFNQAYDLESKVAIYPRIIIDPILFDLFEKEEVEKLLLDTGDGILFINYLKHIYGLKEFEENRPIILQRHEDLFEEYLNKHPKLDKESAKFIWLKRYHQMFS